MLCYYYYVIRKFDVSASHKVHQADVLFLPRNVQPKGYNRKAITYKYALTTVDVASCYTKEATEVAETLSASTSTTPSMLESPPGRCRERVCERWELVTG